MVDTVAAALETAVLHTMDISMVITEKGLGFREVEQFRCNVAGTIAKFSPLVDSDLPTPPDASEIITRKRNNARSWRAQACLQREMRSKSRFRLGEYPAERMIFTRLLVPLHTLQVSHGLERRKHNDQGAA